MKIVSFKALLTLAVVATVALTLTTSASGQLQVYEPFNYTEGVLAGNSGALGTTGVWTATDAADSSPGWWVHPGGAVSGVTTDGPDAPNVFDGVVANLPTSGGYAGMPSSAQTTNDDTDSGTNALDGHIALDASVTASFQSGTTTWFSFVAARAWDRNEGGPQFMIGSDRTSGRGLDIDNTGNGIGAGGGPGRGNLLDIYPQFFRDGVNNHTPGGYQNDSGTNGAGVWGLNDGQQPSFGSGNDNTASGTLNEIGQPLTQSMTLEEFEPNGDFGPANIIFGKIEWDGDIGGEDIISVVRFLELDNLSEAAFDAQIAALPALSSANWTSGAWGGDNKPDLDQSTFDTISFSGLKYFVDEVRIGRTFNDVAAIPEPGSLALLGLGGLAMLVRRRRG